jgi:hypothetical protein
MISALKKRDGKQLGQILRNHLCNKLEIASLSDEHADDTLPGAASS